MIATREGSKTLDVHAKESMKRLGFCFAEPGIGRCHIMNGAMPLAQLECQSPRATANARRVPVLSEHVRQSNSARFEIVTGHFHRGPVSFFQLADALGSKFLDAVVAHLPVEETECLRGNITV